MDIMSCRYNKLQWTGATGNLEWLPIRVRAPFTARVQGMAAKEPEFCQIYCSATLNKAGKVFLLCHVGASRRPKSNRNRVGQFSCTEPDKTLFAEKKGLYPCYFFSFATVARQLCSLA
jgi:hypothetical protein